MSVKIRLTRAGRKKKPFYRIVVMDARHRRDGAYVDHLGVYHPKGNPERLEINEEKSMHWLLVGAEPSDTVRSLFSRRGIMLRFDLQKRGASAERIEEAVAKWTEQARATAASAASSPKKKKKSGAEQKDAASGS